jgi:hypothetical protein
MVEFRVDAAPADFNLPNGTALARAAALGEASP